MSEPVRGVDVPVTEHASYVLAPNPSPMTLDGTNTWLLGGRTGGPGAIVDPGPDDEGHLRAVARAATDRGLDVEVVLITHRHEDHTAGASRLAEMLGVPVRSTEAGTLAEGDVVTLGDLEVRVVATPGHTSDSVSFLLPGDHSLLTGDTVLGRGTTVVAWPDGRLGDYLDSLQRLRALVDEHQVRTILPAHGAPVTDPVGALDTYLEHRRERLDQVRAVVGDAAAEGDVDALVEHVVETVYAQVPREVWPAARMSVRAQLDYLREVS